MRSDNDSSRVALWVMPVGLVVVSLLWWIIGWIGIPSHPFAVRRANGTVPAGVIAGGRT
jgi:hypothetical protein